jgi:peptidoglycan/xylan/chitin deacetylase (PgdA/CDA1 family)
LAGFEGQLAYIARNYVVVDSATLIAAVKAGDHSLLPARAAYLTFDDGLADHYETVFPLLGERGLHGAFFPPAQPVRERTVADVHKIQFILAAADDAARLAERILAEVVASRTEFDLDEPQVYVARYRKPGRFDDPATVFVKRMLQTGLPEELRRRIVRSLFDEIVTSDDRELDHVLSPRRS